MRPALFAALAVVALHLTACADDKYRDESDGTRGVHTDTADTGSGGPGGPGGSTDDTGPGGPGPGGADTGCDDTTDRDGDGYSVCDDCDDDDPGAYPDQIWLPDADGDGYGDPDGVPLTQCERPLNYSTVFDQDCDDTDPDQHPGQLWYLDADGDTYGAAFSVLKQCSQPKGYVLDGEDCDDLEFTVHPDAEEICDGLDSDCDGVLPPDEADADGDGFSLCDGDPDDSDPAALPYGPWSIGGTSSQWTASSYFRGNMYTAVEDTVLGWFDVYLGLTSSCVLDFYVHDGSFTTLWSGSTSVAAGTGYFTSPEVALDLTAGEVYGIGVAWNCEATYYGDSSGWAGYDAGIGAFEQNYHDNYYGGYSTSYVPDGTGTDSLAYDQIIYVTR